MASDATVSSSSGTISSSSPQAPTSKSTLAVKQRESRKSSATTPAFLSNLGRATLRGIRKCPQCGVYNGTRGLSCKNITCGVTLRDASAGCKSSKKGTVEVVRVITDNTAIATGDGATLLTRINLGRCFLSSCRQGERSSKRESGSASTEQSSDSLCIHIKQAIDCRSRATPLTLKSSVLEALQASIQAREELWRLATESPGPLVQRVSKHTLVVKCHTDSQHPLGLLHLTVAQVDTQKRDRSVFHCTCQVSTGRSKPGVNGAGGSVSSLPSLSPTSSQPCLHFYACVCAFSSNEKLAAEFAAFINYTSSCVQQTATSGKPLQQVEPNNSHHKVKKQRLDEPASGGSAQVVDERTVTMGFQPWLASVTERIHQTMHYQFDAFVRNDGLPLGSFSKYTWHITNLLHVKHIFDTPELPLEVTQSFVKNLDGSYSRFHLPGPLPEPESLDGYRTDRPQAIRPMEHRTFLKKESSPFVIEWTPDVLPRCQMGELRISFEFGHQQSGQSECQEKVGGTEKKGCRKSDCSQTKVPKAAEVLQVVVQQSSL
ncbi:hypothetical protein GOODEAATRI_007149 [Goodea atripinnis]|uniref:Putative treble-clef zinc-finger domain-containing protein n=1 Tax=Goodea atripinnis TaxID=208336 RepID=A0ABV0PLQ9_9TELE